MTVTRILHFTTKMVVAFRIKEGEKEKKPYEPLPRKTSKPQTKPFFKTNIDKWKDVVEELMYDKYYQAALDEAASMGTDAYLESFNMYNISTEQLGKPEKTPEQLKVEIQTYEKARQQDIIKAAEKKRKADIAKAIKLTKQQKEKEQKITTQVKEEIKIKETLEKRGIEYEPKQIPTTKQLTAIDISHLSRIQKDITKLEKKKVEQTQLLNVALGAIQRIEEAGRLDILLGQVVTRDRFIDEITRTNIKIERQKEAIQKIKGI